MLHRFISRGVPLKPTHCRLFATKVLSSKDCGAVARATDPKTDESLFQRINNRNLPEVAFLGRSNCGKSSLINTVLGHRGLARTSKTPGRTQTAHYYKVVTDASKQHLFVVDLPGYGFAKVPENVARKMGILLARYVEENDRLQRMFLLIDARRGLTELDIATVEMLIEANVKYQLVLTKCDKVKPEALGKVGNEILEYLRDVHCYLPLLATSVKTKMGIGRLRDELAEAAFGEKIVVDV